ncbi:MAG TPA: hypothetical protein VMS74_08335 [Acidimicrobiia bacterium]|nr:hypothetical protein [Acidimicrobiia bacterium]
MRTGRIAVVIAIVLAACAPEEATPPPDPELVSVAQQICTVLWNWQLDVGGIMNTMSAASRDEADATVRLVHYTTALDRARTRNQDLASEIAAFNAGPYVDRIREDIRNGLFAANRIIDELDIEVDSLHASGATGYHDVVPYIFLTFEKVIDVPKPEMADYANQELSRAFYSVAQCQHGVKDVNDGVPRHVPRS